jgi:Transposase DDE domain
VNPDSGEILASELTSNQVGDLSMVGPLLDQIPGSMASVLADGAYDAEPVYRAVAERQRQPPPAVIIPPRVTAVLSPTTDTAPSLRDRHIQMMQEKGRRGGEKAVGYGKRSLVETAMFRYKVLIGPTLRARKQAAQKSEARIACVVINRMTQLGMPISQRVRSENNPESRLVPLWIYAPTPYSLTSEQMREDLLDSLHGAGAFRHFKSSVRRHRLEPTWFAFRTAALQQIAQGWCEEHQITWQ